MLYPSPPYLGSKSWFMLPSVLSAVYPFLISFLVPGQRMDLGSIGLPAVPNCGKAPEKLTNSRVVSFGGLKK